jgi:hypothetical protein
MAKVHFELAPFGRAVCGKENVDTTKVTDEVTCEACRDTEAYIGHLDYAPLPDGEERPRGMQSPGES